MMVLYVVDLRQRKVWISDDNASRDFVGSEGVSI